MGFLDRVKETVSSAGTGVSQKVSYTTDTMKLNNQIRSNEKEIEKLIYQVGQKCVQLHLHETDSEYEELFVQIRELQSSSQNHQAEIQRLTKELEEKEQLRQQEMKDRQEQWERERKERAEMKQAEALERARQQEIQKETPKKMEQEIQQELDETAKICPICGQKNEADAAFCVYCGNILPSDVTPVENDTADIQTEIPTEKEEEI